MDTTRTPTSARRVRAKVISFGWDSIGRVPDHANAKVILLISAHLESGHYFNPHAQRVIDGKANGAKLIVMDTRLSNTATHADYYIAPYPGSEAAILLAIANYLIQKRSLQS
jgi:anaerobic selenocysteine-containing dehydrogenase